MARKTCDELAGKARRMLIELQDEDYTWAEGTAILGMATAMLTAALVTLKTRTRVQYTAEARKEGEKALRVQRAQKG